jgi:hypothetical protein
MRMREGQVRFFCSRSLEEERRVGEGEKRIGDNRGGGRGDERRGSRKQERRAVKGDEKRASER